MTAGGVSAEDRLAEANVKIHTPSQYRRAVEQAQRLERGAEGTPEFQRRQELLAAMHEYELHHLKPKFRPGRPQRSEKI